MIVDEPHSILIVEDERIVAMDIQQSLRELGHDAFAIASTAEEAIARASEKCPDLVLMDIRINGTRDGIEAADILRTRFGVPVVYLTAHADAGTMERAKRTEPYGYLLKPIKAAELHAVVEVSLYKHKMDKRLRERERWFSTTLRSIADAVIAVDVAGNVTFMNPAAESLTGTQAAASSGRPVHEVLRLIGEQVGGDETPILKALRVGHAVELPEGNLLNLASGALRLINDSAAPVVDEKANQTLGAVMVFRDVTDQKQLQKQLERADRLVSLGTMAAGLAHEVNNPLAVVVANSGFLKDELQILRSQPRFTAEPTSDGNLRIDKMSLAINDMQSAASRIARITSDLRAFSRPVLLANGNVDVGQCIEWAVKTTASEFRHRATVITSLGVIPSVKADEARLGQVFVNLLINAAHAISPGRLDQNRVTIRTYSDQRGWVVVEVQDTGAGIPSDILTRIFEPFFTTKAVGTGTGLGLSISHGIVSSLGGEINAESDVGQGTLIRVRLPAAPSEGINSSVKAEPPPHIRGRILVVDDEEMILRAIALILQDHDVCCVTSAQAALTLIDQGSSFDLILTDITMPTMSGVEFYELLLNRNPSLARRVLFLSGGAITARIDDFLRTVPNTVIEKPFKISALEETIQQALRNRE